jgi:hypothetical protein
MAKSKKRLKISAILSIVNYTLGDIDRTLGEFRVKRKGISVFKCIKVLDILASSIVSPYFF